MNDHTGSVRFVVSLDHEHFVSASDDDTIKLWNAYSFKNLKTIQNSSYANSLVKISNEIFASGFYNGNITIWNFKTGHLIQNFKAHTGRVDSLAMLKDGNLVSCSNDFSVKIWNPNSTQLIKNIPNAHSHNPDHISSLNILNDNSVVVVSNKEIKIWNVTLLLLKTTLISNANFTCILILNNSTIVSGSDDGAIKLWNSNDGKLLKTIDGSNEIWCLEMLPSGYLITGLIDGTFQIFNLETGSLIKTVKHHFGGIRSFSILRNKYLISASEDRTIKVFELL